MGLGADGPVTVTLSVIGVFVAVGMVMPNSIASAIAPYPKMAGAASSLLGLVQMTVGATAGIIVGITFDGTAWPMMFLLSLMNISGLTAYLLLIRARGLSQMQDVPKDDPADPVPPAP